MTRARLLPAVIIAASALLLLKALGLTVRGGYTFSWNSGPADKPAIQSEADLPQFARAVTRPRFQAPQADPEHTGTVVKEETGTFGANKGKANDSAIKEDPLSIEAKKFADQRAAALAKAPATNASPAERQLLERLQERRDTLEGRNKELELREGLLKAAEQKLESRIGDLQNVEGKVFEQTREKDKQEQSQIRTLVTMYETMKPKEAARVFDRLELRVLLSVVTQMNPRKMAEVLAAMSPEAAEKLTVAMATAGKGSEAKPADGLPPAELQRIQPKKAGAAGR